MMPAAPLQPTPDPGDLFSTLADRIARIINRFVARYGGDFDELYSDAQMTFLRILNRHDPDRGDLWNLMYTSIWRDMLDGLRARIRRNRQYRTVPLTGTETQHTPTREFQSAQFLQGLSADARVLVNLVLDAPDDLMEAIEGKGGRPENWSSSLRQYLRQRGWKIHRIRQAFDEVRNHLETTETI